MAGRARLYFSQSAAAGQAQTINLQEVLPYNATLLQITVSIAAVPVTDEPVYVRRIAAFGPVPIRTTNPFEDGWSDMLCLGAWEFRKDDRIAVIYNNTDDQDVHVEVVFREAD
jgi:hypothetical protein